MYRQWVLTALLAWPALAALVVMVAPARWAKHVALAASLVEFAISVPLWWTFAPAGGFQFILDASWIPSWGIRYTVGVDGISLFMVLLTTFLVPLSVLGSYAYITTRERGFYALLVVLTTGMIGVFVALDLFLFYVVCEVRLIPMYFIIGVWRRGRCGWREGSSRRAPTASCGSRCRSSPRSRCIRRSSGSSWRSR